MAITLQNVNYMYGVGSGQEYLALKNINLQIEDGEFVGIVGHSGSGKSTLIQLFNGLLHATGGKVLWNGQDIQNKQFSMQALRGQVGLVFQYPEHQLFAESVLQEVQYGPRNLGWSNLQVQMHAFEALRQVGIGDDLLDVSPFTLSGGQKRRVAIASVLAMKPQFLVLDEPMAGLDPAGREEMLTLFSNLHKQQKITVILVSHNMDDVAKYAERLLVMNQGEIVLDGTPQQIFQYRQHLQKIGLDVPQSASLLRCLEAQTGETLGDAITWEECVEVLYKWLMDS